MSGCAASCSRHSWLPSILRVQKVAPLQMSMVATFQTSDHTRLAVFNSTRPEGCPLSNEQGGNISDKRSHIGINACQTHKSEAPANVEASSLLKIEGALGRLFF